MVTVYKVILCHDQNSEASIDLPIGEFFATQEGALTAARDYIALQEKGYHWREPRAKPQVVWESAAEALAYYRNERQEYVLGRLNREDRWALGLPGEEVANEK